MLTALFSDSNWRLRLETEILPAYFPQCRWYRTKAQGLRRVEIVAWVPAALHSVFAVCRVTLADGTSALYSLPLSILSGAESLPEAAILARVTTPTGEKILADAGYDPAFRAWLFSQTAEHTGLGTPAESRLLGGEQSNTSFVYGAEYFLKVYRRLETGRHPEPEVLGFLRDQTGFDGVPQYLSHWEYRGPESEPVTVALLQRYVASEGNAWEVLLRKLSPLIGSWPRELPVELPVTLAAWAASLGKRTGELHRALGSRPETEGFSPETLEAHDLEAFFVPAAQSLERSLAALEKDSGGLAKGDTEVLRATRARQADLSALLTETGSPDGGLKIRVHGDLHLGQILCAGENFWFLDFEGEPLRPLAERRRKHSPLRDVAGMLRSFHYALHVAARAARAARAASCEGEFLESWTVALSASFWGAYIGIVGETGLLPTSAAARTALLRRFVLEKAVYELDYERNNRPEWVGIPLRGLRSLIPE